MNAEYTGKKIAELRKGKNLTQKELADKLHVTDKAVSKWERGVNFPDLGLMEELATVLDSTPSILLGLEEATKEEVVASFAEISSQQSKDAEKDIQKVGWMNLFAGGSLVFFMHFINIKLQRNGLFFESQGMLWFIYALIVVVIVGALYTLRKYEAIRRWEFMDTILTEIAIVDVIIFLAVQFFTGRNPIYLLAAILIGVAVVSIQLLFYRVMKPQWMKLLPFLLSICWMVWGVLLEISEAAWVKDNVWSLIVYSILPAICALATWYICRKRDVKKESLASSIKLISIVCVVVLVFICLFGQDMLVKAYVKFFHWHLESYAEELIARGPQIDIGDSEKDEAVPEWDDGSRRLIRDTYGPWKVTYYPEDRLVEFHTGGAGLVSNSTYWGFYYSPDNTHKVFQGADTHLNVNGNLADWYEEGDNWGKSTRLLDKWFWFEASF